LVTSPSRPATEDAPAGRASPVDVVFLDWGDTLMMDDGTQGGPMATWAHVAAVPGAQQILRSLRPRYRLIVATNAADSGGDQVRAALARVGLDDLIDDVVTSREVGACKPDPAFFRAALCAASAGRRVSARRAVMVGDSWANDVAGALAAGLRAVWFNPSGGGRPCGAPAPDAEIAELSQLPPALEGLAWDVREGAADSA
jgi:putative hydrolase of the HAD superfamily